MEDFQPIEIELRDSIEGLRHRYGHTLSSHLFASLFIWKETMKLSVMLREELFAVRFGQYGDGHYFFPVGSEEAKEAYLQDRIKQGGPLCFHYMRREDADFLTSRFPGRFLLEDAPNDREYLYDRTEQIELKGGENKYIRHKIKRFESSGSFRCEPLNPDNLPRARRVIERWGSMHSENSIHYADMDAGRLLIDYFQELKLSGCILHDGKEDYSVVIGSDIDENMHDMHIAKCAEPMVGLDYYIKREYYRMLPERIRIINLEEDLGIEGLRVYKERLHPCGYHNMWKGILRE